MFKKSKEFIKKHQKVIILLGGIALGVTATIIYRSRCYESVTLKPEWAVKWTAHCDSEHLLYENGLPIFADTDMMVIYQDALSENCDVAALIENGFKIIDRPTI